MRLKAKIPHALPSFLSFLVIRITGTRAKALSRKITPRMYRTTEDSESSAAPLKRMDGGTGKGEESAREKDPTFGATATFLPVW